MVLSIPITFLPSPRTISIFLRSGTRVEGLATLILRLLCFPFRSGRKSRRRIQLRKAYDNSIGGNHYKRWDITRDGIDGLADPLAQYLSRELFLYSSSAATSRTTTDLERGKRENSPETELLGRVQALEDLVTGMVPWDKACTCSLVICFGNCLCASDQGYQPPDPPETKFTSSLRSEYSKQLESMDLWDPT
jgi:hypothetical protein